MVWCHDLRGFSGSDRTRQLVDKMAETTGWCVVLPDFIGEQKVENMMDHTDTIILNIPP